MLFHRGEYLGTATQCDFGYTSVAAATGDALTVEYRWPREGDANAAPSGFATVTFSWNGTDVTMSEFPDELLTITGCSEGTASDGDRTPGGELPQTR